MATKWIWDGDTEVTGIIAASAINVQEVYINGDVLSSVGTTQGTDGTYDLRATNEGATAGTTARGENSVDLQTKRSNGEYVAAGANSVIIGGEDNGITSTGNHSAIIGGQNNYNNSGSYCIISGYGNNSNIGNNCNISGGFNHSNSGSQCNISGTSNYINSGSYCSISGSSNHSNSGNYCNISGASNHSNSGYYCSISGWSNNSNSGYYCNISGAYNHNNSGNYCNISGRYNQGNYGTSSIIGGQVASGSTKIATTGTSASASTDLITKTSHGCIAGMAIKFTTLTGGTGLSTATQYYVIADGLTANDFKVSRLKTGTAENITVDYTVANYIANAVNYGNFNLISGEDNEGGTGSWCAISGDQNYNNSGNNCNISGRFNHSNSGEHCNISGSFNHSNSGQLCNISGYGNNSNIGNNCSISGYGNNSNIGNNCNISGSFNHSNSGSQCNISGYGANGNALSYARVHGGNTNARIIDLVAQTTTAASATPTELLLGGNGGTRIIIPDQSAWNVDVRFVAKTATGSLAAIQNFTGVIVRDGTTTTYAAGTSDAAITETGVTNAAFAVAADDTNEALQLTVTSGAAGLLRASARIQLTQVDY